MVFFVSLILLPAPSVGGLNYLMLDMKRSCFPSAGLLTVRFGPGRLADGCSLGRVQGEPVIPSKLPTYSQIYRITEIPLKGISINRPDSLERAAPSGSKIHPDRALPASLCGVFSLPLHAAAKSAPLTSCLVASWDGVMASEGLQIGAHGVMRGLSL